MTNQNFYFHPIFCLSTLDCICAERLCSGKHHLVRWYSGNAKGSRESKLGCGAATHTVVTATS